MISMQSTPIPPKRQLHSYTWKPKNLTFTSTIGLLNYLIENNLVVVGERAYPKCPYCNKEIKSSNETLMFSHIFSEHRERVTIK